MRRLVLAALTILAAGLLAASPASAQERSRLKDGETCSTVDGSKSCKVGSYCRREVGACTTVPKGEGVCREVPDICQDDVNPVCGCNGKTYSNACLAAIDDANVAHEGS